MRHMTSVLAGLSMLMLVPVSHADSYGSFVDGLEVDRHRMLFANFRGFINDSGERRVSVVIWKGLHSDKIKKRLRQDTRGHTANTDLELSAGPVRTVFERTFDLHPGMIRISSSSIAILDFHGINYGYLKGGPAVRIVSFDQQRELSFRLEDVFKNATERYYRGRGVTPWLHDAWFDEPGKRLFVMSTRHRSNAFGHEVAIIDLESEKVSAASRLVIGRQLSRVEPRFLRSALDAAISHNVKGVDDAVMKTFTDVTLPLEARARAAAHLAKLGDAKALRLIQDLAKLVDIDPADVRHSDVSPTRVFESDYWWSTIGYAARVHEQLDAAQKP